MASLGFGKILRTSGFQVSRFPLLSAPRFRGSGFLAATHPIAALIPTNTELSFMSDYGDSAQRPKIIFEVAHPVQLRSAKPLGSPIVANHPSPTWFGRCVPLFRATAPANRRCRIDGRLEAHTQPVSSSTSLCAACTLSVFFRRKQTIDRGSL